MEILIVDDEKDVELLFRQGFRKEIREGSIVFHFTFSSEDALEFLRNNTHLDKILILSDINMPGMNGLELLKIIKQDFPHLKVYMITAYGDEKNYKTAIDYGADEYLTKPLDMEKLKNELLNNKY
jgi:YesN/AraC family two-component response regulator